MLKGRAGSLPHSALQFGDQLGHRLCFSSLVLLDSLHNGAANHGSVSKSANFCKLLRIGNTKTHRYRQFGVLANSLHQVLSVCRKLLLRARDTGSRNCIYKTFARRC